MPLAALESLPDFKSYREVVRTAKIVINPEASVLLFDDKEFRVCRGVLKALRKDGMDAIVGKDEPKDPLEVQVAIHGKVHVELGYYLAFSVLGEAPKTRHTHYTVPFNDVYECDSLEPTD